MSELFAGLDVSTQGTKLVVIDVLEQAAVYQDQLTYDTDLPHYETRDGVIRDQPPGVSESDPRMWIEAVETLLARLQASDVDQCDVRCLSVSGQQHGVVALTEDGALAHPRAKLWNDVSTVEECDMLTAAVGDDAAMIAEVGNTQRPGYTASKIFRLARHHPDDFRRAATLFLVHNYVNWYLTGGVRAMEPGDTSGMALWHPGSHTWSARVIDSISPELSAKLPPVTPSDAPIGTIATALAERFGLSESLVVAAGSGDNMLGAVGTGNVEPGIVTVSLGTSGTAYGFSAEPFIDPHGEIAAFCDASGHHLPLLCVSNLANGYNEMLRRESMTHEQFEAIVDETPPANGGRVILPWYEGERTPDVPNAGAVYFGFGLSELSRGPLCRAVVESAVLNLQAGFDRLPLEPRELRLTGGLTRSNVWCQAIADIFAVEAVPVLGEGAALGAALHAGWTFRKQQGDRTPLVDFVAPFVQLDESRRRRPAPRHEAQYDKLKRLFRALSARARGLSSHDDPFTLRRELATPPG